MISRTPSNDDSIEARPKPSASDRRALLKVDDLKGNRDYMRATDHLQTSKKPDDILGSEVPRASHPASLAIPQDMAMEATRDRYGPPSPEPSRRLLTSASSAYPSFYSPYNTPGVGDAAQGQTNGAHTLHVKSDEYPPPQIFSSPPYIGASDDEALISKMPERRRKHLQNGKRSIASKTLPEGPTSGEPRATSSKDDLTVSKPKDERRAVKTLDKEFECPHPDCGKAYSRSEHLYRHQLYHTPRKLYHCGFPGCDREFIRADLCERHTKRHLARRSLEPAVKGWVSIDMGMESGVTGGRGGNNIDRNSHVIDADWASKYGVKPDPILGPATDSRPICAWEPYLEKRFQSRPLPEEYVTGVCEYPPKLLHDASKSQPVEPPVTVCGDIHGQFHDLMELFKAGGHKLDAQFGQRELKHLYGDNGRAQREPFEIFDRSIDCVLDGDETSSFPDTGARANFISKSYVDRHKIKYDTAPKQVFKNGIGAKIKTLGTVMLPLSFKGESDSHLLLFHVVGRALRDVVLGEPFLSLTRTFSHFKHRITRTLRCIRAPRLCYTGGSHRSIEGYLDGVSVHALPDTGSDILVMSTEYAKSRGFQIESSIEHRIPILFADGSTRMTRGVVRDATWQFGSSPSNAYWADFYVLDDLQCDVILSYDFLEMTDCFVEYADSFIEFDENEMDEVEGFYTLTRGPDLVSRIKRRLQSRQKYSHQKTQAEKPSTLETARLRLLQVKDDNMERIRLLPAEQRTQAIAEFRSWWKPNWDAINICSGKAQAEQV